MNMKDKIWLSLATISFVIIGIIVAVNKDPSKIDKTFAYGDFYAPHMQSTKKQSEVEIYQQMIGGSRYQCPVTVLDRTPYTISINIFGTAFGNHYFFLDNMDVNGTENSVSPTYEGWEDEDKSLGAKSICKFTDKVTSKEEVLLSELVTLSGKNTYPAIVAPFNFNFLNSNTDADSCGTNAYEDIIIVNKAGTCRITFKDCANWFCAGPPGTTMSKGSIADDLGAVSDNIITWEQHARKDGAGHDSLIGVGNNALVSSGAAGDIIGYAGDKTKIKIEVRESANVSIWEPISVKDWMLAN